MKKFPVITKNTNWKKLALTLFTVAVFFAMPKVSLAASRYWVGSGTGWNTTASWSTTSGGSSGASVPGTSDDVFFDSNSTGNSILSASISIRSLDMTGYTRTLTHNSSVTLTFAANGGTNVPVKFAGTYTIGNVLSSAIAFDNTTSASSYLFTSGGKTFGNITVGPTNAGNTVTLQDGLTSSGTILLFTGILDTNGQAVQSAAFNSNGNTGFPRTLTFTSNTWTLTGSSSTIITLSDLGLTLNRGGVWNANYSGSSGTRIINVVSNLSPAINIGNFNITGGTDTVSISGLSTQNFNLTGFAGTLSGVGRIDVSGNLNFTCGTNSYTGQITFSATSGTKTITSNTKTFGSVINFDGVGGTWQLQDALNTSKAVNLINGTFDTNGKTVQSSSFFSNYSSPNVSVLTFTSNTWTLTGNGATVLYLGTLALTFNGGGTFNGNYSGSSGTRSFISLISQGAGVNLNISNGGTDIVAFGGSSINNLNFTGFAGTFGTSTNAVDVYGNLILSAGMTVALGGEIFMEAVSGTKTITTNGATFNGFFDIYANPSATIQLADALATTNGLEVDSGTFDTIGKSINAGYFLTFGGNIILGATTFTITGTGALENYNGLPLWNPQGFNSFSAGSATIVFSGTDAGLKTFGGDGITYGTVTFSGDNITVTGNNIFNTLNVNNAGQPTGLIFTSGSTQTVTNFTTNSSAGNLAKISSDSPGTPFILSKLSGTVSVDYMSITDSAATGGAVWNAGAHSVDGGGNFGWIWPPRYWVGGGSSDDWNATSPTNWSAISGGLNDASVPNSPRDIFFDGNSGSGNSIISSNSFIRSLDMTGYTGTLTQNGGGVILTFAASGGTTIAKFAGTYVIGDSTSEIDFGYSYNTSSYNFTSGGNIFGNIFIDPYDIGNFVTLQDSLNSSGNIGTFGTFNTNGQTVQSNSFYGSGAHGNLILGNTTWTITGTDATSINGYAWIASGLSSLDAGTSNIIINNVSADTKSINGGGYNYNTFTLSGDNTKIVDDNVFNTLNVNNAGLTYGLSFVTGTTQTVANFHTNGSVGNLAKISSDIPGTPYTLSKPSGTVNVNYTSITDSTATGGAVWNAFTSNGNINGGGNTGWNFGASSRRSNMFFMF